MKTTFRFQPQQPLINTFQTTFAQPARTVKPQLSRFGPGANGALIDLVRFRSDTTGSVIVI